MRFFLFLFVVSVMASCGNKSAEKSFKVITDLPFGKAQTAKEYADIVLKAIKTNRDKPILQEFAPADSIDGYKFNTIISMYSTGIGGRDDWEFIDLYETSDVQDKEGGFDYAWLDPTGRLGLQIYILPIQSNGRYELGKIEFRSRLSALTTVAFPPDPELEDYKKLEYNWDVIDKKRMK